jgi:hypothetical protein
MIRGTAKFDGLAVGELSANLMGPTVKLTAKAAFVNAESGHTHGWTTNEQWSPTTIEKLRDLRAAMEADLARVHFGDGLVERSEVLGGQVPTGGLAEHLSEPDARQL